MRSGFIRLANKGNRKRMLSGVRWQEGRIFQKVMMMLIKLSAI